MQQCSASGDEKALYMGIAIDECVVKTQTNALTRGKILDAITYIYVLRQQFVGHSVLVEDVEINSRAGNGGSKKETKHSAKNLISPNRLVRRGMCKCEWNNT